MQEFLSYDMNFKVSAPKQLNRMLLFAEATFLPNTHI